MKILKIFGVVIGIHVFALILIFANPGCSSTSKPIPAPSDTLVDETPPSVSLPFGSDRISPTPVGRGYDAINSGFNPDAPAVAAGGGGVRFNPTRPGTPAAETLTPLPVADVTPATTYTVATGDNLWSLSKKFGLTTGQLASANNIRTNAIIHPGQKLIIPGNANFPAPAAIPAAATTAPRSNGAPVARPAGETIKHLVKPGESLSLIAQQYGVRQGDIAVANNISDPQRIRAGMELTIPGWQPPTQSAKAPPRPAPGPAPAQTNEPRPIISLEPDAGAPAPASDIPIIRIDDSPITPVPGNP